MVYSIIPARAGSKGVPGKNIKLVGGYPLIAYTIAAAKMSKNISRVIVSTDSMEITSIAKKYGAEIPFMRPSELAGDKSLDIDFVLHAINWFQQHENKIPDYIVHLRPTTPLRIPSEIDRAIDYIKQRKDATSLRSAHELREPPQKMFRIDEKGLFKGFFPDDPRTEYYNLPRQVFPAAYHPNGYVDIIRPDFVQETNSLHGSDMLAFITPFVVEIDNVEDCEYLRYQIDRFGSPVYEYLMKHFPKKA